MAKEKKKKKNKKNTSVRLDVIELKDKKSMKKEFKSIVDEIASYNMKMFELEKVGKRRKDRVEINKKQKDYFENMKSIKYKKKISKKLRKSGLLDRLIEILRDNKELIQKGGKVIGMFILAIMSSKVVKEKLDPKTLDKLSTLFELVINI